MTILAVLAAGTNSTSTINDVEPGLLGFLVVAALAAGLVFLLRSMNKQFRKIGPRPEDVEADAADEAGEVGAGAAVDTVAGDEPGDDAARPNDGRANEAGTAGGGSARTVEARTVEARTAEADASGWAPREA